MNSISTHVLDTARGRPAAGIPVTLARLQSEDGATDLLTQSTNEDGRVADMLSGEPLTPGIYRLTFQLEDYLASDAGGAFFPKVDITFQVDDAGQHYHVPLLLSPYGYSTYRGS